MFGTIQDRAFIELDIYLLIVRVEARHPDFSIAQEPTVSLALPTDINQRKRLGLDFPLYDAWNRCFANRRRKPGLSCLEA